MENFKDEDFQFRSELASTGYKIYRDDHDEIKGDSDMVLVESRLSSKLVGTKV